jgi:RNA recognition motif-containing protein
MDHPSRSASVERKESYRGKEYEKNAWNDNGGWNNNDRNNRPRSRSPQRVSPNRRNKSPSLNNRGNVLYVGNLHRHLNENDIRERFGAFGKIVKIEMIEDPFTHECRGFCFVEYENDADAAEALENLNQKEYDGRKMKVEVSKRGRGYRKTPGEYLGQFKTNNFQQRSPSPYSRRRQSRGEGRGGGRDRYYRERSPRDRSPQNRFPRDRSPRERYGDGYQRPRRSFSRERDNRKYRGDNNYRDRRRSRSRDRFRNEGYRNEGFRNDGPYRNDGYKSRDYERERSRSRERK